MGKIVFEVSDEIKKKFMSLDEQRRNTYKEFISVFIEYEADTKSDKHCDKEDKF